MILNPWLWIKAWIFDFLEWLKPMSGPYSLITDGVYQGGSVVDLPSDVEVVLDLRFEDAKPYVVKRYVSMPIHDDLDFPGIDWLKTAVQVILDANEKKYPILVECSAGVSRSGMVMVAYIMLVFDLKLDKALAFVRSKRPEVNPNPAFIEGLRQWEHYLGLDE